MDKISKFFGMDSNKAAARQAELARQLTELESARVKREEAETAGAVAAISNRPRSQFLSKAGFSGLRRRLGGPRVS